MHLGYGKNEYGTKISLHNCDVCNQGFSLCPAADKDDTCGHPDCGSYDESRDFSKLLENGIDVFKENIQ